MPGPLAHPFSSAARHLRRGLPALRWLVAWMLTVTALTGVLQLAVDATSTQAHRDDAAISATEQPSEASSPTEPRPVDINIDDDEPYSPKPDERTLAGLPPLAADSSVIALLPDTQFYSWRHTDVFIRQTQWLAAHAPRLDIRFVLHLGDIVHRNSPREWTRAALALSRLDGAVPYAVVPGNHDYGPNGNARTRDTGLNDALAFDQHAARPTFGGAFQPGRLDNTYHLFEASGHRFIVIALEWGPRDEVVAWANAVMHRHPDRRGILVTHAYLYRDGRRYDHTHPEWKQANNPHAYRTPGGVNDGEQLWQKLVRHHPFVMTVNGHVTGTGTAYLQSHTDAGTVCHQMLSNYQMRDRGGEGYLRLLELHADGSTVTVHTYSPWLDRRIIEPDQHFAFELE